MKSMRDAVVAGEASYRDQAALLDLTHDAIFVRNMASEITYWNRSAERFYGWGKEEALGKISHVLLKTGFPIPLKEIESEVVLTGSWGGELSHRKRDGEVVIVSSPWALQRDVSGAAIGMLESNRDQTQRRLLEKRFEDLIESAPEAMVIVNSAGQISLVNAQTEKLIGYSRDELLGRPVEKLIPQRFRILHEHDRMKYSESPHVRPMGAGRELYGKRKDDTEFPVEVSLSPIRSGGEALVSSVIRDVTARHKAERQLTALNTQLEQKVRELNSQNKALESFSYSVSHDLRAPLRHIDGFARILIEDHAGQLSEEACQYLQRIVRAANQMGALIDDLLTLAHLGRKEMVVRQTNLDEIVKDAIASLPPGTEKRAIDWRVAPLGNADCDPGLIKVAFGNLLTNAVKFTRKCANAIIEVGRAETSKGLAYFVRDNGVGFDPRYSEKLFGVFQRLHNQDDFEGTGIGLATVRRIVQRHGGEVWAESEPGRGAMFSFTIGGGTDALPKSNAVTRSDGGSHD